MGLKKHPFAFSFAVCLFQSDQKLKTQRIHLPSKINLEVFLLGVYLSAGALCFRFFSLNPYKPPCCPLCFFMLAVFQGFLFSTPPTYFFLFFFLQSPLNPSHPLGTPWGFLGQLFPLFSYSFPFTPSAPLEPLGFCLEQSPIFHPFHNSPKNKKGQGIPPALCLLPVLFLFYPLPNIFYQQPPNDSILYHT